jgi:hypothetical protein
MQMYLCNKSSVCLDFVCFHKRPHSLDTECSKFCHVPGGYQYSKCEAVSAPEKRSRKKLRTTSPAVNCPQCGELLVHPRGDTAYCEDCGWPDEDFGQQPASGE